MIKDRFPEFVNRHTLVGYQKYLISHNLRLIQSIRSEVTLENAIANDVQTQSRFMDNFFNEVEEMMEILNKIQTNVDDVRKKQNDILSSTEPNERINQQLDDSMADIMRNANRVRTKLERIHQNIEQHIEQQERAMYDADMRIQRIQHSTLLKKFVDVMTDYSATQINYRERCKDRINQQLDVAGNTTTDEELEDMLEHGNSDLFTQGINMDSHQAKQTLADIEARYADIINVENSIKELHDMFMDMAVMIEYQVEMVDNIELQVERAYYDDFIENERIYNQRCFLDYQNARRRRIKRRVCFIYISLMTIGFVGAFFMQRR